VEKKDPHVRPLRKEDEDLFCDGKVKGKKMIGRIISDSINSYLAYRGDGVDANLALQVASLYYAKAGTGSQATRQSESELLKYAKSCPKS